MFEPRESAPKDGADWADAQSYRVWSYDPSYIEDEKPWKCLAAFQYLTECLDYIAHCQDNGADVVFQSPAETKLIRAADRRVVYKPHPDVSAGMREKDAVYA